MAIESAPAAGTIVVYHGSILDYHGECRFDSVCGLCTRCRGGESRYRLTHLISDEPLCCVRPESVSLAANDSL